MSALYLACFYRNSEIVKFLNDCGATVCVAKSRLEILLCQAGFDGDMEFVRLLNICGVDLNLCDYDKRTLGHLAACEGHKDLLLYMSENTNFDFDFTDRFGKTTYDEIKEPELKM